MNDLRALDKYRETETERQVYGVCGDHGNGCFKVFVGGKSFFVVASNGGGWDHVSASPCNAKRCPTLDEMCTIKNMFFGADECVVQYHPPKAEYVNNHPYCLHLWRPQYTELPRPPKKFV